MNKNNFSENNIPKNNAGNSTKQNTKNFGKFFTMLALAFGGLMAAGIISILVIMKRMFESDIVSQNKTPLIISVVVTVAGGVLMALFIILSMVVLLKDATNGKSVQSPEVRYIIAPSVLKDPRIKQLPEVQRLLQYPSVQQAFFDGQIPSSPKELADPHLQELADVLSQLADENGVIRP